MRLMKYRRVRQMTLSFVIMLITSGCTNATPGPIGGGPTQPTSTPTTWHDFMSHTAYGDEFQFSVRYPDTWKVEQFRGSPSLVQSSCRIGLGVGGSGAGGWKEVRSYVTEAATLTGTTTVYSSLSNPETLLAFTSFPDDYDFELQFPSTNQNCLDVYQAVLETLIEKDNGPPSS
jgi:hypothetical protein